MPSRSSISITYFTFIIMGLILCLGSGALPLEQDQTPHTHRKSADSQLRNRLNTVMLKLEKAEKLVALKTLNPSSSTTLPNLPHPSTEPLDGPTLYQQVADATVMFHSGYKCDKCANWHGGVATGFVIHPDGWIVTAAHVLKAADENVHAAVMMHDETVYPVIEVHSIDEERDVALVRVDAKNLPALPLANINSAAGSDVAVISHPQNRFFVLTKGVVSRVTDNNDPPDKRLVITAGFSTGSSGAPVVDTAGNIVGMALSTKTLFADHDEHKQVQLVLKFCVPVDEIATALRQQD